LADTPKDERRISKAEKSAKKALDSKKEKSRVKSGSANYKSNHASFSHVSNSRLGADDAVKSFRLQPFQSRQAISAQISVQERNLLRLWIEMTLEKQLPQSHFCRKIR